MQVVSLRLLREFSESGHADARVPLRRWFALAETARWSSLSDVRRVFSHADEVRVGSERLLVFTIGGNKYRLIVRVRYDWALLNVRAVVTYSAYDKGAWKQ